MRWCEGLFGALACVWLLLVLPLVMVDAAHAISSRSQLKLQLLRSSRKSIGEASLPSAPPPPPADAAASQLVQGVQAIQEDQQRLMAMTGAEQAKLAQNGVVFNAIYGAPPVAPGQQMMIMPNNEIGHPSNFFPTSKSDFMGSLSTLTPPMGVEDPYKRDLQHRYTPMFMHGGGSPVGAFALLESASTSSVASGDINGVVDATQRGLAMAQGSVGSPGPYTIPTPPSYDSVELPIVNRGIATTTPEVNFLRQSLQGHLDPAPKAQVEEAAQQAIMASQQLFAGQPLSPSIANRMDSGPVNGPIPDNMFANRQ